MNGIYRYLDGQGNWICWPSRIDVSCPTSGEEIHVLMTAGWDVLYLLGEYGQSVGKEGCMQRLIKFVGANQEEVNEWLEGGEGEHGSYWKM